MNKEKFMDRLGQIAHEYDHQINYEFVSNLETGAVIAECSIIDQDERLTLKEMSLGVSVASHKFTLRFVGNSVLVDFPADNIEEAMCDHPKAVFGLIYL